MTGTLLALDYPGRRDESRIQDLRLEADGWNVHYLLQAPLPTQLRAAAYAAALRERAPAEPDAVLAYCSGAPIAQELIATAGWRSLLLLFDAEPSPLANIKRDAAAAARQFGVSTSVAGAGPAARFTDELLASDPEQCFDTIHSWLLRLGAEVLVADGAEPAEAEEAAADIAAFYLDWFTFLIAAHNTTWPGVRVVHHVVSADHLLADGWPSAEEVRMTVLEATGRNELLAATPTRAAALQALDALRAHKDRL